MLSNISFSVCKRKRNAQNVRSKILATFVYRDATSVIVEIIVNIQFGNVTVDF